MEELKELLHNYFLTKECYFLANNIGLIIYIIPIIVTSIIPFVIKGIKLFINFRKRKRAIKDLHPFFLPSEIKAATSLYIDTNCQNIPPSDYEELQLSHAFAVQERLMPFFINKAFKFKVEPENRFYFILSDSGMGKTTFLINLYVNYSNKINKEFNIKLLPLGSKMIDDEIKMVDSDTRRKTILLLDAFDEDIKASNNYKDRLKEIVNLVWDFRIVIITSRTQFFDNDINEPNETGLLKFGGSKGLLTFQKIYISPFSDNDIKKYLRKKFSLLKLNKRRNGFEIIKNCPNLMVRPMLLSYIEDLLTSKFHIRNASQSYEALIEKWIDREVQRIDLEKQRHFKIHLRKFSEELALNLYRKRIERGGLHIPGNEIEAFAKSRKIDLSLVEMKSRSLLNRHSNGYYKFSHRSILEYLLAIKLLENKTSLGEFDVNSFDQAYKFYLEMFWDQIRNNKRASLNMSHKMLYELKSLPELSRIRYLELNNNYISDLKILSECQSIVAIQLNNNKIEDINPLSNLINLQFLFLRGNKISNLEPIYNLKNLIEIELTSNPITMNQLNELKSKLPNTNIIFR